VRFADTGDEQRKTVAEGLRDALGGAETARKTAEDLQGLVGTMADEIHARRATRGLSGVRKRPGIRVRSAPPDGWADFEDEVTTYPASEETLTKVRPAAAAIRNINKNGAANDADVDAITIALADDLGAKALAAALQHVAAHEPVLVGTLRDDVLPGIHRAAVGELLR
jgi:hypothetical protein